MTSRAREARVIAQAKVNLFLRVLGRGVDGYHSIETLFLRLELGDVVRVRVGGAERQLRCQGAMYPPEGLGPADQNLAYRAAVTYADAARWPDGFTIDVDKRVPVGGGLGGGSADAAAVLRALDDLAPEPLGPARVRELAAQLGADVPFLVTESACALAWGRGERLLDVAAPPVRDVELLVPSFGVSTRWAYEQLAASRRGTPQSLLYRVNQLSSWPHLAAIAANDLQTVVAAQHPEIADCVALLRARGATIAMMSGSGSSVFGVFDATLPPGDDAWTGARAIMPPNVRRFRTRTSDRVVGVERIE